MDKKKRINTKNTALIISCCVLALILVALIGLLLWAKGFLGNINRINGSQETLSSAQLESLLNETDPADENFSGPVYRPEDVTLPTQPAETIPDSDDIINILLVGQDRREGQVRQRSDAMILCTVNKTAGTLTMTSFLRDTWVHIPGYYDERLNVPYAIGGFKLLNETLEYNFGISADYNIEVDFSGFEQVIDLVGGVEVSLTNSEAAHLNKYYNSSLIAGKNLLNGKLALAYSRIRALDNDFGRTGRQRTVLTSLVNKAKGLGGSEMLALAKGVMPMLTTDMSDSDIVSLVFELAPLLTDLELVSQRIPMDDAYQFASIDGKSVILLNAENLEKNIRLLKKTMGEE